MLAVGVPAGCSRQTLRFPGRAPGRRIDLTDVPAYLWGASNDGSEKGKWARIVADYYDLDMHNYAFGGTYLPDWNAYAHNDAGGRRMPLVDVGGLRIFGWPNDYVGEDVPSDEALAGALAAVEALFWSALTEHFIPWDDAGWTYTGAQWQDGAAFKQNIGGFFSSFGQTAEIELPAGTAVALVAGIHDNLEAVFVGSRSADLIVTVDDGDPVQHELPDMRNMGGVTPTLLQPYYLPVTGLDDETHSIHVATAANDEADGLLAYIIGAAVIATENLPQIAIPVPGGSARTEAYAEVIEQARTNVYAALPQAAAVDCITLGEPPDSLPDGFYEVDGVHFTEAVGHPFVAARWIAALNNPAFDRPGVTS